MTDGRADIDTRKAALSTARKLLHRLELARAFLHSNMNRNVTLGEIAAIAGLSQMDLARYFKDAFGEAPTTYHRRLRIESAGGLLAGGHAVAEAAEKTGSLSGHQLGAYGLAARQLAAYQIGSGTSGGGASYAVLAGVRNHLQHGGRWEEPEFLSLDLSRYDHSFGKLAFATSAITPIASEGWDELVEGTGGEWLYGGVDPAYFVPQATSEGELKQETDELLKAARNAEGDPSIRAVRRRFEEAVFSDAIEALGGARALGMVVRDEADLLRAIGLGFPASILASLRELGFRSSDLEGVIAPRRTLARRKAVGQRLSRVESDAAWRVAHMFSLGARVLRGPEAALAWLSRPKAALGDQIPVALLETGVGAQAVERLLYQLEWGEVA